MLQLLKGVENVRFRRCIKPDTPVLGLYSSSATMPQLKPCAPQPTFAGPLKMAVLYAIYMHPKHVSLHFKKNLFQG